MGHLPEHRVLQTISQRRREQWANIWFSCVLTFTPPSPAPSRDKSAPETATWMTVSHGQQHGHKWHEDWLPVPTCCVMLSAKCIRTSSAWSQNFCSHHWRQFLRVYRVGACHYKPVGSDGYVSGRPIQRNFLSEQLQSCEEDISQHKHCVAV